MTAPERIFAKSQYGFEGIAGTWLDESDGLDMTEYTRTDLIPAMLAEAKQRGREAERERADRYRYVLEGVKGAIDTGRNEPLQIWRDQIDIALDAAAIRARGVKPAQEGGV